MPSGANAIALKFYDKDLGRYRYKILITKDNSKSKTVTASTIFTYLNEHTGITSDEAQRELQGYIKSNDTEGINGWVKKYFPTLCYLKLDENDQKYTDIKNAVNGSQNDYYASSKSDYDLSAKDEFLGSFRASFGLDAVEGGSGSSGGKSYDSKEIGASGRWAPTDRAVTKSTIPAYEEENFPLSKYWVTEDKNDGNNTVVTPATDENLPSKLQDQTALTNPDYGKTGTPEKIPDEAAPVTMITVGDLTTEENAVIDLVYANTKQNDENEDTRSNVEKYNDNGYSSGVGQLEFEYTDAEGKPATKTVMINRELYVENARLGEGTTFRLGAYKRINSSVESKVFTDAVYLGEATANTESGKADLYIELGWVPELKEGKASGSFTAWATDVVGKFENRARDGALLGILEGAENFNVQGRSSLADGIWSVYEITPDIGRYDDYFTDPDGGDQGKGTLWYLNGYSYADTGMVAESGQNVAVNSTVLNNFVKANNDSLFRRPELLHGERLAQDKEASAEGTDPELQGELRESIWAEAWHGKFDAKAAYGRQASQSYNGYQVGYDKLLHKSLYGGRVYTGFYVSKMEGSSNTLGGGSGDQDSLGVGMYTSWVGEKGDFLDLGLHAFKVEDEYHFTANTGDGTIGDVKGDYDTWAYGLGAKYGHRHALGSGWYLEPSASFFMGHVEESDYRLSNNLGVHENGYDTAVGRLNLKAGRQIGDRGSLYAGLSWGHEFAGGQKVSQYYGEATVKVSGNAAFKVYKPLETVGGQDSWWEWSVGGRYRFSSNGVVNVDFSRAVGSDLGNSWSINGGLDFSWGGFGEGKAAEGKEKGAEPGFANAHGPTVSIGQAPKVGRVQLPHMEQKVDATAEAGVAETAAAGEDSGRVTADETASVSGSISGDSGSFELGGLTVEANRPDWEKKLSPGQVSVIYTKDFEGEQKDLPDLLDRVPGLFVQRLSGDGHYTVARVRGSTASQVSVFVDGVQMNLTGDSAVNLSAIPVDNVERIEVYRGYVPARFAGAPLGGVINIVTKKPKEGHGHISQGTKSYGGYNATYEYSMPLGGGSLLATYARDIWRGDFEYDDPRLPAGKGWDKRTWKRYNNDYQNSNALLKWQDDHWTVKAVWKKEMESTARGLNVGQPDRVRGWDYAGYGGDDDLRIDYKEFLLGRRDTIGNLDVGWHIAYLDSKKDYTNTGGYNRIKDGDIEENEYLPGMLWGTYHSKKWNVNLNMAYKAGNNHLLELNADATRETMDCNGNRWGLTESNQNGEMQDTTGGLGKFVRGMLYKYNNREYHLTLQDSITLNDDGDFKLTPVLRADKVEMDGLGPSGTGSDRWKYSGGVALQKQINDHWSFKTTWGTYNRHPNFYEIFGDGGFIRPNYVVRGEDGNLLSPGLWESGKQFDFSLNWQGKLVGADTDTILTWFRRDAENQLMLATPRGGNGLSCYVPTGEIQVEGFELSHVMKWRRLNLTVAATKQRSKRGNHNPSISWLFDEGGDVPEFLATARVDYTFPGDKLNIFAEYHYTYYEGLEQLGAISTAPRQRRYAYYREPYSTLDLGFKYKFAKNWRLTAGVNDVLDKGKEVFVIKHISGNSATCNYYPLPGRVYYATLECSF